MQNVSEKKFAAISFTVRNEDLSLAKEVLNKLKSIRVEVDTDIAKVAIVGAGMQTHPGIAAKMFKILADKDINIEMISTSPIRISCVVNKSRKHQDLSKLLKMIIGSVLMGIQLQNLYTIMRIFQ
ncbi:unnamed protein product [marine sediment metagenome]|uniref:aspartate kinase n=1 Tax=marine sediment metagenome TaxID=412755 RepID=X1A5K2_9ZZZZ